MNRLAGVNEVMAGEDLQVCTMESVIPSCHIILWGSLPANVLLNVHWGGWGMVKPAMKLCA